MSDTSENKQMYSMEDIKGILGIFKQGQSHSYVVGINYFIRTVTMAYTGRLVDVTDTDLVLEECAWIPDTGKYSEFLSQGKPSEVEPYPQDIKVQINRYSVIDASPWKHQLFTKSKNS